MTEDNKNTFADWQLELAKMKANLPIIRELMAFTAERYSTYARQYKTYFDALILEGFTQEQAMEIIKAHGWMPK